jgi:formylglycine-generating enzyme required for sulfatase activity
VNDKLSGSRPGQHGQEVDSINSKEFINEKRPRQLRGGSFYYLPEYVRSADRGRNAPSNRAANNGFRPARTYH